MSDETRQHAPSGDEHWEALARYLAGESPVAEVEAVQRWLAEHGSEARTLAALDAAMDRVRLAPAAGVDVEAALRRVKSRIAEPEIRRLPRPMALRGVRPTQRPLIWRMSMLATAAVVMFVIAAQIRLDRRFGRSVPQPTVDLGLKTYSTAIGRRDSVRLADGSRVILGPGSTLHLNTGFGGASRNVELQGEAYFDVKHDASSPFTIHTPMATITDVGTSFGVHDDSGQVRVSVTSGEVRLAVGADSGVLLHAGDLGVANRGSAASVERGAASPEDLAWTHGQLVFRDATLSDVAVDLHRWYGVTLRVGDPALEGRHVTASFAGDSARAVMRVIALSLGAQAEWHGDTAVLKSQAGGGARLRNR